MGEVGRLDYETSGLIMMTDDSKMLRGIIDPVPELENSIYHSKEYILGL
jgi:16S rRNA U516 pseudouridylate synthase RsuA-like enzyme